MKRGTNTTKQQSKKARHKPELVDSSSRFAAQQLPTGATQTHQQVAIPITSVHRIPNVTSTYHPSASVPTNTDNPHRPYQPHNSHQQRNTHHPHNPHQQHNPYRPPNPHQPHNPKQPHNPYRPHNPNQSPNPNQPHNSSQQHNVSQPHNPPRPHHPNQPLNPNQPHSSSPPHNASQPHNPNQPHNSHGPQPHPSPPPALALSPSQAATLSWFKSQGVAEAEALEALRATNFDPDMAQTWLIEKNEAEYAAAAAAAAGQNGEGGEEESEELPVSVELISQEQRRLDKAREAQQRAELVGEDPLAAYPLSAFLLKVMESSQLNGRGFTLQLAKAARPTLYRLLHLEEQTQMWYPFSVDILACYFRRLGEECVLRALEMDTGSSGTNLVCNSAATSNLTAPEDSRGSTGGSSLRPTTSSDAPDNQASAQQHSDGYEKVSQSGSQKEVGAKGIKAGVAVLASKVEEMNQILINGECDDIGGLPKMFRLSSAEEDDVLDLTED